MSKFKHALNKLNEDAHPDHDVVNICTSLDIVEHDSNNHTEEVSPEVELCASNTKTPDVLLDADTLRHLGVRSHDTNENWLLANAFRRVAEKLLEFLEDTSTSPAGKLVYVTSTDQGDGKTFCGANIALELAQICRGDVLLVDADVESPNLTEKLKLMTRVGYSNLIQVPRVTADEIFATTSNPRLRIVPSGTAEKSSVWSLSKEHEYRVLSQLGRKRSGRNIILDGGRIEVLSQNKLFLEAVDSVVVVVKANMTSRRKMIKALKKLNVDPAKIRFLINEVVDDRFRHDI